MATIRRLAPSVSSLIAAGEVVERPASALKELIENALDAGARRISVEFAGAGKSLIRVSDDGRGMDREDCALCLERHATSKISTLGDLDRLATFGFRGEALFAIAAVSKLALTSACQGAKGGWRVEAQAGEVVKSGPAPAPGGTTVEVRDLFFNTPARLRFLRSDAFESSRLIQTLEEAALANPETGFSLKTDGRKSLSFAPVKAKSPLEAFRTRVKAVLGAEASEGLVSAVCERPGFKAWLFFSPADRLAATRSLQHWLVNKRPVQSRALQSALYRAFRDTRTKDRHPVCVAHLALAPDQLDVNVHPGKREIRFKSEREVHDAVAVLIERALIQSRSPLMGSLTSAPIVVSSPAHAYGAGHGPAPHHDDFLNLELRTSESLSTRPGDPAWWRAPYRYLGQIEGSFLVFEAAGGLFVLDQHAAAERILFEKYMAALRRRGQAAQPLMLPLALEIGASRRAEVLALKDSLAELGFEVEPFGKTAIHLTAAPAVFRKASDLKDVVLRLLDYLEDPAHAAFDVARGAAATVACKRSVKAHDPLTQEGALRLLEDLKDCADGTACPHGRPTMLAISRDELARRFDRSGAP
ncbi:MAG: DNA mismatch repair endonuclease MutL [Elusimicrobia bacterium]|nr:DNA mismatch repair endonuclease MutL [Elusimicrobiota bacterium]